MPYFKGSTANPTGIRPWNFAMQGNGSSSNGLGLLGRMGRLGFYVNSAFPLPQASNGPLMLTAGVPGGRRGSWGLGDFLPRIPLMATSPYSGKADYGDPKPVYSPLNPTYYKMGLGAAFIDNGSTPISRGRLTQGAPIYATNIPTGLLSPSSPAPAVSAAGTPIASASPVSTVVPAQAGPSWWQQAQANLAAQQAAAQQATASSSAAAPSSQSAVAAPAAMFTTDSAGDIIYATGGSIFLTAAQAAAIGVTAASLNAGGAAAVAAASTAAASAASTATAAAPSWFTDPNQALITGLPNWGLLAIAGGAFYLFKKK